MSTTDVLDRIDDVLEGYVTWHGSEDSADSTADDDLGEDQPSCWICGWSPSEGPDHDQWVADDIFSPPHSYEAGPQPTGDVIVSLMGAYELDGVARCPGIYPDDPDDRQWSLYRYLMRTGTATMCSWTWSRMA